MQIPPQLTPGANGSRRVAAERRGAAPARPRPSVLGTRYSVLKKAAAHERDFAGGRQGERDERRDAPRVWSVGGFELAEAVLHLCLEACEDGGVHLADAGF